MVEREIVREVQRFVEKLKEHGFHLDKVILYGSRVSGKASQPVKGVGGTENDSPLPQHLRRAVYCGIQVLSAAYPDDFRSCGFHTDCRPPPVPDVQAVIETTASSTISGVIRVMHSKVPTGHRSPP